jgi:hypothetical protein
MVLQNPKVPTASISSNQISIGAAGDSEAIVNANYGALNPATLQQYLQLGKSLYPAAQEKDPWLTAFQFFTNMAAEASKPGATAIGAAGTAGATTVNTLLEERKQQRAERLGAATLGVSLASTIGARKPTLKFDTGEEAIFMSKADAISAYPIKRYGDFYRVFETADETLYGTPILSTAGRPQLVKRLYKNGSLVGSESTLVPSTTAATQMKTISGDLAIYMSPGEAKKYIVGSLGIPETHADYARIHNFIATNDASKQGQGAVRGGAYIEIKLRIGGNGQVLGVALTPASSAGEPWGVGFRKKQGEAIVKDRARYYDNIANVLPRLETVQELLLAGAKTGIWQSATSNFRSFLVDAFGASDPDLVDFQTLEAASYYIATKMRPKGSGSTSDMEFSAYQKAGLHKANTPFSNYISIWQMQRAIENAQAIDDVVLEMVSKEASPKEIREKIEELDTGFYEKFESTGLERTDDNVIKWWNGLPSGAVIFNRGNLITGSGGKELGMFIVKMPDGTVGSKISGFGGR